MKTFIILILSITLHAKAENTAQIDHLAGFNNNGDAAHAFCNIIERVKKLPEVKTSCRALILVYPSPSLKAAMDQGEFGSVVKVFALGDSTLIISNVTIEQLEILRFDSRIEVIAPDTPVGGVGAFTVTN